MSIIRGLDFFSVDWNSVADLVALYLDLKNDKPENNFSD